MKTTTFHWPVKIVLFSVLVGPLTATLHAQVTPPPGAPAATPSAPQLLSEEDLNELLGPIALYPDALVSLILPASTTPSDITVASRYLNQNGDTANVADQPWSESVRALAKYPDVLKWMDENLEWTNSLGEAFVDQPADVMKAVQRLRVLAQAKGNLVNTPQQTVVVEQQEAPSQPANVVIRIVPADPEIIYVPRYDPAIVYVQAYQPDYVTPLITFGMGFAVGSWLNYDCDWHNNNLYWGNSCGWNNQARWNNYGYRNGNVNVVNTTINNNNNTTINNYSNASQWYPSESSQRHYKQNKNQNIGNSRIAQANAQNLPPGAANTRTPRMPKPREMNGMNSPGSKPANYAPNANNKANRENRRENSPGQVSNADVDNTENAGATADNPNRATKHQKPTAAPAIAGQTGKGNPKPDNKPNASVRTPGEGTSKRHPTTAPSVPGDGNKPSANKPYKAPAAPKNPTKQPRNPQTQGQAQTSPPKSADHQARKPSAAPQQQPRPQVQRQNSAPSQPRQQAPSQAQQRPQRMAQPQQQQIQQQRPQRMAQPQQQRIQQQQLRQPSAPQPQVAPQQQGNASKSNGKKKKKED